MNKSSTSYCDTLKKNSSFNPEDLCNLTDYMYKAIKCSSRGDAKLFAEQGDGFKTKSPKENAHLGSKSSVDNVELDADYVESLATQVKELKKRLELFESQQLNTKNDQDEAANLSKHQKHNLSPTSENFFENSHMLNYCKRGKNCDNERSIYTANERNHLDFHEFFQQPKCHRRNKSNVSVLTPVRDNTRRKCESAKIDSAEFKTAAEEFLQQAEELKSKITYILDYYPYAIPSPFSNVSTCGVRSDITSLVSRRSRRCDRKSIKVGTKMCIDAAVKDINGQYSEILKFLTSIDSKLKVLTVENEKESTRRRDKLQIRPATEVLKQRSSEKLLACKEQKVKKSKSSSKFKKKFSSSRSYSKCKNSSDKAVSQRLEPIVMVYKPIEPYPEANTDERKPHKERKKIRR